MQESGGTFVLFYYGDEKSNYKMSVMGIILKKKQ